MERPTLMEALAVAQLVQERCGEAVSAWQHKCSELERQVEQLRNEAEAVRPPQLPPAPLAQLVAAEEHASPSQLTASFSAAASQEEFQMHMQALAAWHQATTVLPAELLPALASAQHYLLLGEQQQRQHGRLAMHGILQHTPVTAMLRLAADILQACSAAAAASASQPPAAPSTQDLAASLPAPERLSAAHSRLLSVACSCLVHLCNHPGLTAADSDFEALHQFGTMLLCMAAAPPLQPASMAVATPDQQPAAPPGTDSRLPGQQQQQQDSQLGLAAVDVQQPTHQLARQVLCLLRQSATAGTVLLICTAHHTRDCMASLVAAVLGEQAVLCSHPDGGGYSMADAPSAAAEEEAHLLHAFMQLSQQLSASLRLLPQWMRSVGMGNEAFMQDLADAVMSARSASELIRVTHPQAARQMQRVAAQMVAALQAIAADDGPRVIS